MAFDDYNCVLCDLALEDSLVHLFLAFPFARSCLRNPWFGYSQQPFDLFGTLVSFKN